MEIYKGKLGAADVSLTIEDGFVVEQVRYPMGDAAPAAHAFLDKSIDGLEAKIPGDWDKVVLEPARIAGHELIKKYTGA
jgi:hypothetical protein